jgi:hypothetical protein
MLVKCQVAPESEQATISIHYFYLLQYDLKVYIPVLQLSSGKICSLGHISLNHPVLNHAL